MSDPASRNTQYLFTSESVSDGHPDKICDQISDAILDAALMIDPFARVAVETAIKDHHVFLLGEISGGAIPGALDQLVRKVLVDIGHGEARWGLDPERLVIHEHIGSQSREIGEAVRGEGEEPGAGDQGIVFGYATSETEELMPMPISLAHELMRAQRSLRNSAGVSILGPDAKAQITLRYRGGEAVSVETVVLSTQHTPDAKISMVEEMVREGIIRPVLAARGFSVPDKVLINPSGGFTVGGPIADAGLTGRKIIVDTYGGAGRHGGGAFSGKDCTKVDRSGAYAARQLARSVVAGGFVRRCEIRVSYAIGEADPIDLSLDTFGSSELSEREIFEAVLPEGREAFRPGRIIRRLNLRRPIYRPTAAFGHFGRPEFPWER